jgi:hypothetical protein
MPLAIMQGFLVALVARVIQGRKNNSILQGAPKNGTFVIFGQFFQNFSSFLIFTKIPYRSFSMRGIYCCFNKHIFSLIQGQGRVFRVRQCAQSTPRIEKFLIGLFCKN